MEQNENYSIVETEKIITNGISSKTFIDHLRKLNAFPKNKFDNESALLLERINSVCHSIAKSCLAEKARFATLLKNSGIKILNNSDKEEDLKLNHSIDLRIHKKDYSKVLDIAKKDGYFSSTQLSRAALHVYPKIAHSISLIKTDENTTRINLKWNGAIKKSSKIRSYFIPTIFELSWLHLPFPLWPAYYLLRPVKILYSVLTRDFSSHVQPYLGTPMSLIGALLKLAQTRAEDVLVDLGCGDGRILIEAVKQSHCSAIGIESNNELYQKAFMKIQSEGLQDKISLLNDDFNHISIDQVSVVFVFLPVVNLKSIVPQLIRRLPKGSRIVAHEQSAFDCPVQADLKKLIVTESAITLAYLWHV